MGVGLFVMCDPETTAVGEFTANPDGRTVAAAVPRLDKIAKAKRLPPFSRFIPDDDIEAFLDAAPPAGADPPEFWFDPAEGERVVAALAAALRSEQRWAAGRPEGWAEEVAGCLDRLRADLRAAAQAGARFSLSYS